MALAEKAFDKGQTVYVASYRGQRYREVGSADVVVDSAEVTWSGVGSTGIDRRIRALGITQDQAATVEFRDSRKAALLLLRDRTEAAIEIAERELATRREQLSAVEREIEGA